MKKNFTYYNKILTGIVKCFPSGGPRDEASELSGKHIQSWGHLPWRWWQDGAIIDRNRREE